jgi:hypothetical protein
LQASYLTTSTVSTANGAEKIAIQLLKPDILLLLCLLLLFCPATRKIQRLYFSHHLLAAHCITTDIINVQAADGTLMLIITTNCFAPKTGIQH